MVLRGWALTVQGQHAEGLAVLHQGCVRHQELGATLSLPYYLALEADACGRAAQSEAGRHLVAAALAVMEAHGEGWWEAENYRLNGELLRQTVGEEHSFARRARRSGKLAAARPRHRPSSASEVVGAARGGEPGTATPTTNDATRIT